MAISFQYNKTELQRLNKQLKIRTRALPTLKNKESALRLEVKKAKNNVLETENELSTIITQHSDSVNLWNEFMPELLSITEVRTTERKVAGVSIPVLEEILLAK